MNRIGYLFADRGERLDEAVDLLQRALKIDPGNPSTDSLGMGVYQAGRLEQADDPLNGSGDKVACELGDPGSSRRPPLSATALRRRGPRVGAGARGDGENIDRASVEKKLEKRAERRLLSTGSMRALRAASIVALLVAAGLCATSFAALPSGSAHPSTIPVRYDERSKSAALRGRSSRSWDSRAAPALRGRAAGSLRASPSRGRPARRRGARADGLILVSKDAGGTLLLPRDDGSSAMLRPRRSSKHWRVCRSRLRNCAAVAGCGLGVSTPDEWTNVHAEWAR